jgi:hypothetical protein
MCFIAYPNVCKKRLECFENITSLTPIHVHSVQGDCRRARH